MASGFRVELVGPERGVPLDLMISVMGNLQRVVYLIASDIDGVYSKERVRITKEIKSSYSLLLRQGASDKKLRLDVIDSYVAEIVLSRFMEVCASVSAEDSILVLRFLPSRVIRHAVVRSLIDMIPEQFEDWSVRLFYSHEELPMEATITSDSKVFLDQFIVPQTVTGEIDHLSTDGTTLQIKYPPTGQILECSFEDKIDQDRLHEISQATNQNLIKVTGKALTDQNGDVFKVIEVEDLAPVDLSPISLSSFEYPNRVISFRVPVTVTPTLDESMQLLVIEYHPINLHVWSETRNELLEAIRGMIEALWDIYVVAPDNTLTGDAQELKYRLINNLRESEGGRVSIESQSFIES